METTVQEKEAVKMLTKGNAKKVARELKKDRSAAGIFPNGKNGDFSNPDIELFTEKYGGWWKVARILFIIAKFFTNDKVDQVIDELLKLGDDLFGG